MPFLHNISYIIFPIIVCFGYNKIHAQRTLNRNEIFDRWTKENGVLHLTEMEGLGKFVLFDTLLNVKINTALKEVEQSNVDTVGIFAKSYPGYNTMDSCHSGYYPTYVYLFWRSLGIGHVEKITGKCQNAFAQTDSVKQIFDFFKNNFFQIDSEYIMPVIFNVKTNSKDRFNYESIMIDHEPNYFIFCKQNKYVKFLSFTEDHYTNKKSVFLKYNLQSKSYEWFRLIDSLLGH